MRTDIEWVGDDVISYRNKEKYEFDSTASETFSQDDEVIILNPVWNVSTRIYGDKFCSAIIVETSNENFEKERRERRSKYRTVVIL